MATAASGLVLRTS